MTTITIKIEAPELAQAILLAAERLTSLTTVTTATVEVPAPKAKPVAVETVRAKLVALNDAGRKDEVRGLLDGFGAKKLTDVPAERLGELLAAAEAL